MTRHFGEHVLPVKWLTESLEAIHETTGLPWWATISITTVIFKSVLTFPLAVLATKNKNRLLLLNPELQKRIQSLRHEVEVFGHHTGLNKEYDKRIMFYKQKKRLKRKFYVEKNVHPMKSFASVFTQLPLWVYLSFALRHLSGGFLMENVDARVIKSPGMLTEGTLWFTDLTVPDPTLLLPIIMCVTNLTNIQLMVWDAKSQGMKPALIGRIFVAVGRFFSVMIIPLGTIVPSALVLYWTVSAFYALIQNIALRNERVMLALGIPILPKKPPPPNIVGSYPPKKKKTKGSKTKDNNKEQKDEDIKEERSS
ncbi:hypothetical protein FSP39_002548 [Pinctada imbricata]|uniref:Membrane insertase YidC/Oxa/ALB C-terminal domain-containing protein n=1 Tax=Pinctada imbricata TaxID=66713 RepID=A0AA88YLV2_PINIB|nr:hypothetical protein FSP39_002548 [Pinctada imbricata]